MQIRLRARLVATLLLALTACGGGSDSSGTAGAASGAESEESAPTSFALAPKSPTTIQPAFTKTTGIEFAPPHLLDIYQPLESGSWPVVVVVHGLGQAREQFAPLAEAIAAEGAVVFNISVTFSVPPLSAIEDIACAVRFARATAPEYGGDPTSISLVGNSSGAAKGSIVAMDGDAYNGDCVVSEGSALPDVLVGYEGPYDYATHLYGGFAVPALQEEDPETWAAVNPYSHIGGNSDLVVRLIHGRDDDLHWYDVLPDVSAEFHQALAEAGYDVELTYVDGASHGALQPGTEAFEVTVQQVMATARELKVAKSYGESSETMTLTFGSNECVYEGPSVISAGAANLTFVNNSGAIGAVNVIELLDDKRWEDLVEYAGEQPSSKHAPTWTRSVRQWRPIPSGQTLPWEEELTPGTYALVCANIAPLAVWLGSSLEVAG